MAFHDCRMGGFPQACLRRNRAARSAVENCEMTGKGREKRRKKKGSRNGSLAIWAAVSGNGGGGKGKLF